MSKTTSKRKMPENPAKLVRDLVKSALANIEQVYESRGALTGIPTGFRDLDRITSGLHAGKLIVIAARPSTGQTSLAMNIAENVAIQSKLPVAVFSLQMSAEELVRRMLCSMAKVSLRSDSFPSEGDHRRLTASASKLMEATLLIDDTAGLTIGQLRTRARRMKTQHDIRLLVVDYLQLIRACARRAIASWPAEIGDITQGVKALAMELNIPVIVLSHLNRETERREGNRPDSSDLPESGLIERNADVVGLLVRTEMCAKDQEERNALKGKVTLMIAKQCNGPTGDVELAFLSEYGRFENPAQV
jgi:replicative DNA helicase